MATERGDYRAIRVALINGPDYQRLTAHQRLVLLTLKVTFHSAGIEVHYPEALAHQLAAQTGLTVDQVRLAIEVLEHGDWIAREGNIVWIRGQLEYGNLAVGNGKHRAAVRNAVSGLPHLSIVAQYVREHEAWFTETDEATGNPYHADGFGWAFQRLQIATRMASESQSNGNRMASELKDDTKTRQNDTDPAPQDGAVVWPKSWAFDTSQRLASHGVIIGPKLVGDHAKPVKDKVPWDEWLRVVDRMAKADACAYGWPAALRRLKEFRDAAQPDPNRDMTLAELEELSA